MDFTRPNPAGDDPPFEQLRLEIARRAASGDLPAGTRLPTVRALAGQLGLAPNTVAKTYRALESDGVVVTEGRRGTFVASAAGAATGDAAHAAATYAKEVRRLGLGLADALRLVERAW